MWSVALPFFTGSGAKSTLGNVASKPTEVADAVGCAATDPRVGVVVVQSRAACRDVSESALGHLQGPRAQVAVIDGSAGRNGDPMARRPMHASTPVDLADLALLVVSQPQLAGRRVAFVTNGLLPGHLAVNHALDQAGLFGPDLTQHAEQRTKCLSPGTRMRGAVTALASDVGPQALLDVLTTIGERGVDAVVLALDPTLSLGTRDIDGVLRSLNGAIPSRGHRERGLGSSLARRSSARLRLRRCGDHGTRRAPARPDSPGGLRSRPRLTLHP
jgi:hypothetical protein